MKALIDINTIHYNPTGPGDYNLPSSFGVLPPPRKKSLAPIGDQKVLATKPRFSLGGRIEDKRVFENNLHSLHSSDAPPLGSYDPVNPRGGGFEDNAKLDLIRANHNVKHWDPSKSRTNFTHMNTDVASETQKNSKVSLTLPKATKPYAMETLSPHMGNGSFGNK